MARGATCAARLRWHAPSDRLRPTPPFSASITAPGPPTQPTLLPSARALRDFFPTLALTPDGATFWEAVRSLGPSILVDAGPGARAGVQIRQWVAETLPSAPSVIITCSDYQLPPNTVLVDTGRDWEGRCAASGGTFLHHTSAADTVARIQSMDVLEEVMVDWSDDFVRSMCAVQPRWPPFWRALSCGFPEAGP